MRKFVTAASTALLFGSLSLASAAMAGPGDRPAGTAMGGTQNMAATSPPPAQMNNRDADDATANSNGAMSTDRDQGLDRGQDRANAEGLENGQAFQTNKDADDKRADTDDTKRADADDQNRHFDADDHAKHHDADDKRADADDHRKDRDADDRRAQNDRDADAQK